MRLTAQLNTAPPAAPIVPANSPSSPYSTSSTAPTTRELAPSVFRIAVSYTRRTRHRHRADENEHAREEHEPPTTAMPSVTFAMTPRTVSSTSRMSITDTFENRDQVPLQPGSRLDVRRAVPGAMKPWGAASSTPGRNTNMNPPARLSRQLTSRTLVTRATIGWPRMSNRTSSPPIPEALPDAFLDGDLGPVGR